MPEKLNFNDVSRQSRDLYEKGRTSFERGTYDAAFHFLMEALVLEPGFFKARSLLRAAQIKKKKAGGGSSGGLGNLISKAVASPGLATINVKKDPAKAIDSAEKALCNNPFNTQALKIAAEAAELLDLYLTATFCYETAREANPDNFEILSKLGALYQTVGKAEKAQECFQRILDKDPANAEAFKGLKDATANQAMEDGKWEAESFRDNIKDLGEATSLENNNRMFKEEEVIRTQMAETFQLTQEQPQNVSHWKKLGDLALQVNEYDYGIQCLEHAYALTNGADAAIERSISDVKLKKVSNVIKEKEALLKLDPANPALIEELGNLKAEREKTILGDCEARSKRYPNDQEIRYELARAYFKNKMIDKAIPEFQQAASNPKNKVACTSWMGKCFKEKNMLDMAVQRFKTAADQCPIMDSLKKDIVYNLGIIYEKMGKKDQAIEQYKAIYDVDVNYLDVSKKIEDFYRDQSGEASSAA